MRPTRPQMFMDIAHIVAKRSTCMRLNVGAVIVQNRRIVSIGYNGSPSKTDHCSGNSCPGKKYCKQTIHAEVNALKYLSSGLIQQSGIITGLDMYVTDSPCPDCFDEIKNHHARIDRIFFGTPYRLNDHLIGDSSVCTSYNPSMLHGGDCRRCGHIKEDHSRNIGIYRVTPAGYIIDWRTKDLVNVET